MTANRVSDFETWVRSMEKRVTRLERKPRGGGGDGGGTGEREMISAQYDMTFINGVATGSLPPGVVSGSFHAFGSFDFDTGEEVGISSKVADDLVYARAAVSDGLYHTIFIFAKNFL